MKKQIWFSTVVAVIASLMLASCATPAPAPVVEAPAAVPATEAPKPVPATEAPKPVPATEIPATEVPALRDTMIAAWVGPCCNGNDWVTPMDSGGDAHWFSKIYSRLTTFEVLDPIKQVVDYDSNSGVYGKLTGDLAESWGVSDDKLTWTFNLRKGVTWHDGVPFTAKDIKFTVELCFNPKNTMNPCHYVAAANGVVGVEEYKTGKATEVSGVKVVDDNTISFTFVKANSLFPVTINELFILPEHTVGKIKPEGMKEAEYWKTSQIGTGPFKWVKWEAGVSTELAAFDNYWRGKPKLAKIIRRHFEDTAAALIAFDAGEIQFTYITADEVARERENAEAVVHPGNSGVDNALQFNSTKYPVFGKIEVRQAIMHAIDRQGIIDNVYQGAASMVSCLYGLPNLNAGVKPQQYDPALAKELVKPFAAELAKLPELQFDTYYADPLSLNVMTAIAQNLKDNLGLNLKPMQMTDGAAWTKRYYKDNASDVSFFGAANGPTGDRGFSYFHSDNAYPIGSNGVTGRFYKNATVDQLLTDARADFDTAAQDAKYQQVCEITKNELPNMYVWQTVRFHVVSKKVNNIIIIPAAGGGSYYDAAELWTVNE